MEYGSVGREGDLRRRMVMGGECIVLLVLVRVGTSATGWRTAQKLIRN